MIQVFFDGKEFNQKQAPDFKQISEEISKSRQEILKLNLEDIIGLINNFSQNILRNHETVKIEGIAFLSQWARKSNIESLIEINFEDKKILSDYYEKNGKLLIAQPKGIIGHWIAGNVVTLGLFSLLQSLLMKNSNILRIPLESIPTMVSLLKVLRDSEFNGIKGSALLSSTYLIYFTKEEKNINDELSMLCDARIIWGGEEAIKAISDSPKKETCEDILFGPKYSFSIIDKDMVNDSVSLSKNMNRLVYDIIFSEQNSCTSPQVMICECSYPELEKVALEIKKSFENLPEKYKKTDISSFQASSIIKIRTKYALEGKKMLKSEGNDWTILLDNNLCLEEPIKSRTIFLKSCDDLTNILKLITPKIQTIGYAFKDKNKLIELSKKLNLSGVSRIVALGQMNFYDLPWDGKMLLARLINFNSLKVSQEE